MSGDLYATVDQYLHQLFDKADGARDDALVHAEDAGLPSYHVAPVQGRLLQVLAHAVDARSVLEIGTLAGYSALWLARALPEDGRLISLEREHRHAEIATQNIRAAGLEDRVDIRVGDARILLATLEDEGAGPFDFVFIDADAPSYVEYLNASIRLSRPGTLIVADNVLRAGAVLDPRDEAARGAARFNAVLASDDRVEAVVIQHVGAKGHDGIALAVVRDPSLPPSSS